jgi:drug/metabolite transporter (DMT)-like permease
VAVAQALLVTFLWATSWVLIKIGLGTLPALTFAGLRYCLAFLCLLPLVLGRERLQSILALPGREWARLAALGLLFYAVTQGAQFVGLASLPAVTVSLLLNLTTVVVAVLGIALLGERPGRLQWAGVALSLAGVAVYFYPALIPAGQRLGLAVTGAGVLANALSAVLGRSLNRATRLDPLAVTAVSMGIGAAALLLCGLGVQGLPRLSALHWLVVGWLAVVNTAFAFTLWNHTLRTLSAVESSIINSTMLVQIALLAWLLLGERFTSQQGTGMVLVALGALLVQLRRKREPAPDEAG